jgi:hypothetical protein
MGAPLTLLTEAPTLAAGVAATVAAVGLVFAL